MTIPSIRNSHDPETRNIINRNIDVTNNLGQVVQNLVAKGQLTPEQYEQLIIAINGLIKKGQLVVDDIDVNQGKIDLRHLSADVKAAMTGNTPILSEVADGAVTTNTIASEAVTPNKTNFFTRTTNLISLLNMSENRTISDVTGLPVQNNNADVTDFIEIKNGPYRLANVDRWALYDVERVYIPGQSNTTQSFIAIEGAAYVRLVVGKSNHNKAQMNPGTNLLPYESPYIRLKNDHLPEMLQEGSYAAQWYGQPHTLDFNFIEGKISATTGLSYLFSDKKRHDIAPQTVDLKDFGARYYNLIYDTATQKIILERDYVSPKDNQLLFGFIDKTAQRVYGIQHCFVNRALKGNPKDLRNFDFHVLPDGLDKHYELAEDLPDAKFIETASVQDVHDLFDELMTSNSDYITKSEIGKDAEGTSIYRYDFNPEYPRKTYPGDDPKNSKIFVVTGVHGSEKATVPVMYNFFKKIIEDWRESETLETLRFNYEYVYIPILNPSGWALNTRKNSNGVDLNRNFPSLWTLGDDTSASTYGGPEPLSEPESLALYDVLMNEQNMLMYVDFHNFSSDPDQRMFIWNIGASLFTINVGNKYLAKQSREWQKKYDFLPQNEDDFFGWSSHAVNGSTSRFAETLDSHGYCFEICETLWTEPNPSKFSENVMTLGLEAWVNFLRYQIKNILMIQSKNGE